MIKLKFWCNEHGFVPAGFGESITEVHFNQRGELGLACPLCFKSRPMKIVRYTGLKDKKGVEIYEGDIVGKEGVYHFIDRDGWKPSQGDWKIIGEKLKNFTGENEEKYIAGYELKVVEWKDSSCGFEPFSDSYENCGHCGGGESSTDFEVIGNIYENPELLTNQGDSKNATL